MCVCVCVGEGVEDRQGHMRVCERLKCVETASPWQQSTRGRGRQPRSGLKSERLPGQRVCGLAPVANGLGAAHDSDAIRDAAAD